MIDIHCHLLPGVDDGPADIEEALEMIRGAEVDGVSDLVATPHQRHPSWPNKNRWLLEKLFAELCARTGETPGLHLGAEVHVDSELFEEVENAEASGLLTLAGSRYLLLEFDTFPTGPHPRDVVREVLLAGHVPILAHPERIPWLAEDTEVLAELVAQGALLQITASSLTGDWGRYPQACSRFLLDNGLLHFVASDAHDSFDRQPVLSAVRALIAEGWGDEVAQAVTHRNAAAVLADRPL
jgi:protein-tyrosine phosphatase